MINRSTLLTDAQKLLKLLEADLLERSESADVPEVGQTLRGEFERAKASARTAQNYENWRSDAITQAAAAWVLSCVFVRFLEDNQLIDPPKIAGPGARLQRARDEWELYLAETSQPNERAYLLAVFDALATLPGARDLFGAHNPIRQLPSWLSGDAARELLNFFQRIDADSGLLVHDFSDPDWDTRFLGDLYQDLSEAARKKYALLQTPEFIEEFILDRTLDPALDEFGLDAPAVIGRLGDAIAPAGFRMIDPACGSGHFLLGSFRRILARWEKRAPGANARSLAQRALDSVFGVDVNPYAVAIARFRLLLAALRACGVRRLADAPAFQLNLACGDSLLHGPDSRLQSSLGDIAEIHHAYQPEDLPLLGRFLTPGTYHAVVANPPYIVPRDRALNEAYRLRYSSCHMKYSLAVPFLERIFRLAIHPGAENSRAQGAGYTGQITANSFMKREFGKKLIEEFLPQIDLTHVIDTSGAYIPGHGTPTVILFGRHRPPLASTLRTVMGIRGEPSTPDDPARGLVWSAIVAQIDRVGSQSEFVSVNDSPRDNFHKHPWSIGGGGAAELKEQLDEVADRQLSESADSIGITSFTLEDDIFILPQRAAKRSRMRSTDLRTMVIGDAVRDWSVAKCDVAVFPYTEDFRPIRASADHPSLRYLWPARTCLSNNKMFGGKTKIESGLNWFEYGRLTSDKLRTPLSIVFAFVATHNHFVLDRGGKVFNRSAPVIKLPADASEDDHLGLLGLLNSSTACFWMKQIFHDKGSTVDSHGARQTTVPFENFREFTGTGLLKYPVPAECPTELARRLDQAARRFSERSPAVIARRASGVDIALREAAVDPLSRPGRLIALQEELDWECYRLYGLLEEDLVHRGHTVAPIQLGQRAFEIVLARKMARGELETTWFARHGSTPITDLPAAWDPEYRDLVERRIQVIETNPQIALIEQPEYKRRWNLESWESQQERALRGWLLDRLESYFDFDGRMNDEGQPTAQLPVGVISIAHLADLARADAEFLQVGELYRDDPAFDVLRLVAELVEAESVPLLPMLRYKPTGLRKRAAWEETWTLQREQDELAVRCDAADERIQHVRARVRASFTTEVSAVQELNQRLTQACLSIRNQFAPQVQFEPGWDGDMMRAWLGQQGIDMAGAAALDALSALQKQLHQRTLELDLACNNRCAADPEYQAAVRERDAIPPDPDIDIPPKYGSGDFVSSDYWRLRGKLDVPKERWVSFPHCEGADGALAIAWAGYDHLQLARAVSMHYVDVQERLGGPDDPRLPPLLACLLELLPWIKQWHNEPDSEFNGMRMGDYFDGFIVEEARRLGKTLPEIQSWTPPARAARRGRRQTNA